MSGGFPLPRLRGGQAFAGMTSPGVIFKRVSMGLWPTRGNENPRRPRAGGDPCRMDSRLRGNDESGRDFQESEAKDLLFFARREETHP